MGGAGGGNSAGDDELSAKVPARRSPRRGGAGQAGRCPPPRPRPGPGRGWGGGGRRSSSSPECAVAAGSVRACAIGEMRLCPPPPRSASGAGLGAPPRGFWCGRSTKGFQAGFLPSPTCRGRGLNLGPSACNARPLPPRRYRPFAQECSVKWNGFLCPHRCHQENGAGTEHQSSSRQTLLDPSTAGCPSPPNMKVSVAALAVLLVVASFSLAVVAAYAVDAPPCCNEYTKRPIPRRVVRSFFPTDGSCALPAVVFLYKRGGSACADPNATWTINLMDQLKSRRN